MLPTWATDSPRHRCGFTALFSAFFAAPFFVLSFAAWSLAVPPENFKVAFIGDQGLGPRSEAVLRLIRDEGAQLLVHLGDYEYQNNPAAWEAQTNRILGSDFPYIAVMGNHDVPAWAGDQGYAQYVSNRLLRMGVEYVGEPGIRCAFKYRGLFFVTTTPGLTTQDHAAFIRDRLSLDSSLWRISAWHVNQRLMQVGSKGDEAGWGVYEESRRGGAIIATAHEHSYSRTHLLSVTHPPIIASRDSLLVLRKGHSFVFVSGLGGEEIRPQVLYGDWWAKAYTSNQGAQFGALFATFHVDGEPRLARFEFKNIAGEIIDRFTVQSEVDQPLPQPPPRQNSRRIRQGGIWPDPREWGLPLGSAATLFDTHGRALAHIENWKAPTPLFLDYRGIGLLRIHPKEGRPMQRLLFIP